MSGRKKKHSTLLVRLLAFVAAAVAVGLVWRWAGSPSAPPDAVRAPLPTAARAVEAPGRQPAQEEFSAAERQRLEDILRQKKAGAQR